MEGGITCRETDSKGTSSDSQTFYLLHGIQKEDYKEQSANLGQRERGWSQWYSSDSPGLNGVDNETVSRIALVFDLPCRPSEVEEAECREIGTNESFSDLPQVNGNALLIPCNASGLVCRDEDQLPELGRIKCFDYEIRILCGPLS
ncbi:hypothetical protein BaRGS_00037119, partial [Batillaria attramentaria]